MEQAGMHAKKNPHTNNKCVQDGFSFYFCSFHICFEFNADEKRLHECSTTRERKKNPRRKTDFQHAHHNTPIGKWIGKTHITHSCLASAPIRWTWICSSQCSVHLIEMWNMRHIHTRSRKSFTADTTEHGVLSMGSWNYRLFQIKWWQHVLW